MSKRELTLLAVLLTVGAAGLHYLHFLIFRDAHHIFLYLLGDIAFLPVEVLVVTLLVDRLLSERERAERRHKMNMVLGVFFSELGRPLLGQLREVLSPGQDLLATLEVTAGSTQREIMAIGDRVCQLPLEITLEPEDMSALQTLLEEREDFTLRLLANPVLLDHEEFTDTLWAVVHLGEELKARRVFDSLPSSDVAHLEGDTQRVYRRLLRQWLQYLAHLKQYYPYLDSFAVRANPFERGRPVNVME